ncbi:FAA hydrolase family protein [Acinetobacter chengduensis]|uniref:FAA hydrolase family protein n=2 Tax=Moraxellaceae TaxID=468 RepID=A0ABX9TZW4_9GAMM|nr:fumarylacetoacetate hydrolase family protein [Acinetobacter sp. FL51]RKG43671.1 FAA hydrolase family protein [Acinetobacter sp. WCHAc060007]RLL23927.1 FAA hydrolase family protein [Acinetobacter chengduensis]
MKLCMFNENRLGLIEETKVYDISPILEQLPKQTYPFPTYDLLIASLDSLKAQILKAKEDTVIYQIENINLLSPVLNPGKIIAAPVNYQAHFDEAAADEVTFPKNHVKKIQESGLFLKSTSSLIGMNKSIEIGFADRRTDHEIELVVIMGKTAKNIKAENALEYIAGYSIGLDMTIRGPEERSLRKSLDSYSVLGPYLVTADEIPNPHNLELKLYVNGELRQHANTQNLIMNIPELIEFASKFYTLYPGDLLYTGTPAGVGIIQSGDLITAQIDKLGQLKIHVK